MKNFFVVLMFLLIPNFAFANIGADGLTPEQKAQLELQAAQMRKSNVDNNLISVEKPTIETVKEYADIGAQIGVAFAETAEHLGVAVNEFAQTPVGKLTFALIVYKLIGEDILQYVTGSAILVVGFVAWIYFFRRMCLVAAIEYDTNGKKKLVRYGQTINERSSSYGEVGAPNYIHEWRAAMFGVLAGLIIISQLIMWL